MNLQMTLKRWVVFSVVGIGALAATFAAGRYSKPVEVKVVTKTETKVEYRDKIRVVKVKDQAKHQETTTTTTKTPDGTVTTTKHTTTDTHTKTNTNTDQKTTTRLESKTFQFSLERNDLPSWRASALVGWDIGKLRLDPASIPPKLYGLELDRRIVGTVWGGVWAMTNKTAGLSLSVEF